MIVCIEAGCPEEAVLPRKTPRRCRPHERQREHRRGTPAERGYDREHVRASALVRGTWVQQWGLLCPGWGIPAHPVNSISDLHADHVVAGRPELGYQVLCGLAGYGCNMRRANASASAAN